MVKGTVARCDRQHEQAGGIEGAAVANSEPGNGCQGKAQSLKTLLFLLRNSVIFSAA
jgi:hypothetical protein